MFSAMRKRSSAICGGVAVALFAAYGCWAQARLMTNGRDKGPEGSASTREDRAAAVDGREGTGPSFSDAPAQPAKVILRGGKLKVEAKNSDLTQILRDLANISGMNIKGLDEGPRIFGVYGPGDLREVLTNLLDGSGYNFIMVGSANDGAPRELLLTPQIANPPALTPMNSHPDSSASNRGASEPAGEDPIVPERLGPGAVYPVPPQSPQDENTRIQQNLQRLQRMHEQQQNAQQ
jgi:hypothetical protein